VSKRQAAKRASKTKAKNTDLATGAAVELRIERIVPGGAGLAHAHDATFFVSLAAPGERIIARVERTQKRAAFASLVRVIEPSTERIAPPCKFFGRCGGCDFQHLNYEAQLAAKKEIVRDCLRRIARIENPPDFEIVPSPQQWNYRARARWQFDARRKILGYYELASHRILDVDVCPLLTPPAQEQLNELRAKLKRGELPAEIDEIQIAVGDGKANLAMRRREDVFTAEDELTQRIGTEIYYFNAAAFFQTNHALLPSLIEEALRTARGDSALDLYCGVGLFTVPLARRFSKVVGVEGASASVNCARRNLKAANLTNAAIINARVGAWLNERSQASSPKSQVAEKSQGAGVRKLETEERLSAISSHSSVEANQKSEIENRTSTNLGLGTWDLGLNRNLQFDFVLLDPPRTGADAETIDGLLQLRAPRIAYVSCDPATLARDLRLLLSAYRLESIKAFDMFPQTHHVETIVHLAARGKG
jgi:23S rRNA (uracil1939-C5)-methyltransferase